MTIQDRAGQIRVHIKGKGGDYPITFGDEPLQATIVVGDHLAGYCGRSMFDIEDCRYSALGSTLSCGN
jgi:hypothetical protein